MLFKILPVNLSVFLPELVFTKSIKNYFEHVQNS